MFIVGLPAKETSNQEKSLNETPYYNRDNYISCARKPTKYIDHTRYKR